MPAKSYYRAQKDVEQTRMGEADSQKRIEMAAKDHKASQARYNDILNRMAARARRLQGNRFAILAEEGRAEARRGHHG